MQAKLSKTMRYLKRSYKKANALKIIALFISLFVYYGQKNGLNA